MIALKTKVRNENYSPFISLLQEQHVVLDLKQEIFLIKFHNQLTYKMGYDIFLVKHVHVIPRKKNRFSIIFKPNFNILL